MATSEDSEGSAGSRELEEALRETKARHLFRQVRCVECANQTIEEAYTDFAIAVRKFIRDEIRRGSNEDEIKDSLRQQYGDHVLYENGFSTKYMMVWAAPVAFLLGVAISVFKHKFSK